MPLMTGSRLTVIGAGGHAKVVALVARLMGMEIERFVDTTRPERDGEEFAGARVVSELPPAFDLQAAVAFGDNRARLTLGRQLLAEGANAPVLVHPSACVSPSARLGAGCVVMAQAVVSADAELGCFCIVNSGAVVEHDCILGDGVHVAPKACLCGNVTVGDATHIGAGSTVREKTRIGADVMIGAGSVVVRDIADQVKAWGVPARVQ